MYSYKIRETIDFSGENSPTDSGFNSDDTAKKPKVDQNADVEDILGGIQFTAEENENWDLKTVFESIQTSDLIANDGLTVNPESTKPTPTPIRGMHYRSHGPDYYSFWDFFTVKFLFSFGAMIFLLLAIWYFDL